MADLPLTKVAGRLKVNIGAVLRTRVNTGDYRFIDLPADRRKRVAAHPQQQVAELG